MEWIRQEGFAGWMIWALAEDDFTGAFCRNGSYPIVNALYETLEGQPAPGINATTVYGACWNLFNNAERVKNSILGRI